jgi:hypothetical protein
MGARGEWVFRGQFLVVSQAERLKSSKLKVEKRKRRGTVTQRSPSCGGQAESGTQRAQS